MSDVASLSVGLNLNAAKFKSQLLNSYGFAEKQSRQYTKVAKEEAKKTADAFALINKELNFSLKNMMALAGVGFSFNAIITVTRKYSQSLSDLSAITEITGKRLDILDNKALKMSRNSQFSASQIIDSYKSIASAKPEILDVSGGLEQLTQNSITLAQAAGTTLPEATKTLTLSLNQFGANASDADRYINVLAAGAKFGASEINETALAIKNSGVAAAQANLSFEELNAAIQLLADREVKGGEAGTALRNIILKLEKSTDKNLKPSIVGLEKALSNLSDKNLSTAQAVKLFGLENINAASILMQSKSKLSILTQQLTGTNTAYEQSSTRVNTLNGDLNLLSNSFDSLVIKLGQSGTGPLRSGIQSVSSAVNYLADNFNQIANIGLYTLVPVLATKLTSGLRLSTIEWYKQESALKKTAIAQAETAKATITSSQATIADAQAQARALVAHQSLMKQHGINVNYQKEHIALSRTIREARIMEANAVNKLAASNNQLAISSRIAATAGGLAKTAFSFIGGPFGVAMLAGSALFYFAQQSEAAKQKAISLKDEVALLADEIERMDDVTRRATAVTLKKQIVEQEDAISILEGNRTALLTRLEEGESGQILFGFDKQSILDDLDLLNGEIQKAKDGLNKVKNEYKIATDPEYRKEQLEKDNHSPKNNNGRGNNSIWGEDDPTAKLEKYNNFRTSLEIANATSLEKINLQEQQAKNKLTSLAKEMGVSGEQLQKDLTLITEKYTKDRQQLVEQYSPSALIIRQAKETNYELSLLYQKGLMNKELYESKLVDPAKKIRSEIDPDFKIKQDFELKIIALNDYLSQEKTLLEESRIKNELDEESYQERLLEINQRYAKLKLKSETEMTQKLQETSVQASQNIFNVTSQFASLTSDLLESSGQQNTFMMKALLAAQKALAIPSIIVQTQTAASAARAHESLLGGWIAGETAAKLVEAQGAISVGIVAGQALSGMAHDGIDSIPREGTWLLDKGERVVDARTNADLKGFIKSNKSGGDLTINIPVNISDGQLSEADGKQLGKNIEQAIRSQIQKEQRPGGLLNRR